jgi:hypothetical protein
MLRDAMTEACTLEQRAGLQQQQRSAWHLCPCCGRRGRCDPHPPHLLQEYAPAPGYDWLAGAAQHPADRVGTGDSPAAGAARKAGGSNGGGGSGGGSMGFAFRAGEAPSPPVQPCSTGTPPGGALPTAVPGAGVIRALLAACPGVAVAVSVAG